MHGVNIKSRGKEHNNSWLQRHFTCFRQRRPGPEVLLQMYSHKRQFEEPNQEILRVSARRIFTNVEILWCTHSCSWHFGSTCSAERVRVTTSGRSNFRARSSIDAILFHGEGWSRDLPTSDQGEVASRSKFRRVMPRTINCMRSSLLRAWWIIFANRRSLVQGFEKIVNLQQPST